MTLEFEGEFSARGGMFLPVPPARRFMPTEQKLVGPGGKALKVTVDDSGTVMQLEDDEHLHAIVSPAAIRVPLHDLHRADLERAGVDREAPSVRFRRRLVPPGVNL